MERVTVVRRRKANSSVVTSPVIKPLPPNVTKNSSIDSDDVCKYMQIMAMPLSWLNLIICLKSEFLQVRRIF